MKEALEIVIKDLDAEMQTSPNSELASVTNFLQARLENLNKGA